MTSTFTDPLGGAPAAQAPPAGTADDVSKVYGSGAAAVHALREVVPEIAGPTPAAVLDRLKSLEA